MVTAIVLVTCEVDQTPETAQALADLDGVSEVYSVAGDWDLVAIVRVGDHDDLAATVTEHIRKVGGVAATRVIYTESHDEVLGKNGKRRLVEDIWPGNADSWAAKKRSTLGAALVMTAPGIWHDSASAGTGSIPNSRDFPTIRRIS